MSWIVIELARKARFFRFNDEAQANAHAEASWSSLPHLKTIVAKIEAENVVQTDLSGEDRGDGRPREYDNLTDGDLLACLEHLITEGGIDNFLEASRAGVVMIFTAGNGATEMEWCIMPHDGNDKLVANEGAELVLGEHGFELSANPEILAYEKMVPARNLADLAATVQEARDLILDLFHGSSHAPWHISLILQCVSTNGT
jgi:hypothetical protein